MQKRSTKTFFSDLRALLNLLPTEIEKQEILKNLQNLIQFFSDLKNAIESIPTIDDPGNAERSISRLEEVLNTTKSQKVLRTLLGSNPTQRRKSKSIDLTEAEIENAKSDLNKLEGMPLEDLRSALRDENRFTSRKLYAILSALGVRPTQNSSRDTLTSLISTKISNYRGYKILRGESTDETSES